MHRSTNRTAGGPAHRQSSGCSVCRSLVEAFYKSLQVLIYDEGGDDDDDGDDREDEVGTSTVAGL